MSLAASFRPLLASLIGIGAAILPTNAPAADIEHTSLGDGIQLIVISGDLEAGDEAKFRRLSVQYDDAIVALASDGGALDPAIEIGKMIRLKEYPTVVLDDYRCTSACALIWVAGSTRFLAPRGRVGFHASYRDDGGKKVETGLGNALVGRYLTLLNLPERAVLFATLASPEEVQWLSNENMRDAGIDFEVFNHDPSPPPLVRTPAVGSSNTTRTAGTGWQLVASSDTVTYYMDLASIFNVGRYRAAWTKADHSIDPDVSFYEAKDLWYYDCTARKSALKSYVNFDKKGGIEGQGEIEDWNLDWISVVPDSVGDARFQIACR